MIMINMKNRHIFILGYKQKNIGLKNFFNLMKI